MPEREAQKPPLQIGHLGPESVAAAADGDPRQRLATVAMSRKPFTLDVRTR